MAYLVERLQALVVQNVIHHFGERFPESAAAHLNMAVLEAVCAQPFQCKFDGGLLTRRIDEFRSSSVTDCHTGFLWTATEVFGEGDAVVDFFPRHFIVDEHQAVIGPDAAFAVQQCATFFGSFGIAVFLVGTAPSVDIHVVFDSYRLHIRDVLNQRNPAEVEGVVDQLLEVPCIKAGCRRKQFSHLGSVKAVHPFSEIVQFMDIGVSAFNGFQSFGTNEMIDEDCSFVSDLILFRQSHDLIIGAWK